MKIYTNDLVKGHSDFKVKCLTFGLYTQVSDSGPLGPLVEYFSMYFYDMNLGPPSVGPSWTLGPSFEQTW